MERLLVLYGMILMRPRLAVGGVLIFLGVVIAAMASAYFVVDVYARAHLDDLTVSEADTPLTRDDLTRNVPARVTVTDNRIANSAATAGATAPINLNSPPEPDAQQASPESGQETGSTEGQTGIYDEYGVLRDYSHYVSESQLPPLASTLGAEFRLAEPDELANTHGLNPKPTRIIIPAIGLDSHVVDLHMTFDGGDQRWETADNAVGFHVGSATPGEIGSTVMSGHVNSPFRGEGDIFRRLDNLAPMLRQGQLVDIVLEAGNTRYLYRATDTTVLLPADVHVFRPTDEPSLSLVTCAPATTYSHRFIVNAILVGTAPLEA